MVDHEALPVIYTAVFGGRDRLRPPIYEMLMPQACRWVRFTDQAVDPAYQGWENVRVHDTRSSRWYKWAPTALFPAAPWSIWVDGTHQWREDPVPIAEAAFKEVSLATFGHWATAAGEYEALRRRFPSMGSLLTAQYRAYTKEGFDYNTPLRLGTVLFRRHTAEQALINTWVWDEVERYGGERDQLALLYILWKHHVSSGAVPGNPFFHPWFRYTAHEGDRGTCYPEIWGPFSRTERKRFRTLLPFALQQNWVEQRLEAYLARWHGRGEPEQYPYYRCRGCRHLVTWNQIRRGGCDCQISNQLTPAQVRWWECGRLLLLPWIGS